jgi:hypothetical protein
MILFCTKLNEKTKKIMGNCPLEGPPGGPKEPNEGKMCPKPVLYQYGARTVSVRSPYCISTEPVLIQYGPRTDTVRESGEKPKPPPCVFSNMVISIGETSIPVVAVQYHGFPGIPRYSLSNNHTGIFKYILIPKKEHWNNNSFPFHSVSYWLIPFHSIPL